MRCTLVSNKIIQARERLGLTQQQLAEKLCVTNKAVSKWECGVTLPDISLLVPLCRVLGLTVQELLEASRENLQWMQEEMQETRAASQRESEKLLKEFQSQAGKISETYSSRLSRAEDTLRESANSIRWKMYIPTIILVLWELVRHLWLRG